MPSAARGQDGESQPLAQRVCPPPCQISLRRGPPRTRTWNPVAASGCCLGPPSTLGLRTAPLDAPLGLGWSSGTLFPARASRPKAPRGETPRAARPEPGRPLRAPAPSGRPRRLEGPRRAPPRAALDSARLPAPAAQVRAPGSPSRFLLPRAAFRLTAGGRLIAAATPAELRAPATPGPVRGRRPRAPALPPPLPAPAALRAPSPSASPAGLPPDSAPSQSRARLGPFQPRSCGSSESSPPPSRSPQPQGSPVPTCRRAGGLGQE